MTKRQRNEFRQWLGQEGLHHETIDKYDKLLAGKGPKQNRENMNNALKNINCSGHVVYDLTNGAEPEELRKECLDYKHYAVMRGVDLDLLYLDIWPGEYLNQARLAGLV